MRRFKGTQLLTRQTVNRCVYRRYTKIDNLIRSGSGYFSKLIYLRKFCEFNRNAAEEYFDLSVGNTVAR